MRATSSPLLPLGLLLSLLAACNDGSDGAPGSPGTPGGGTDDDLVAGEDPPGIALEVLAVTGATGPGGKFQPGDLVTVEFRIRKDDGQAWNLDELAFGRAHLAGPSFNYQRVLPELDDVRARAVFLGGGRWRYTFAGALPAAYSAPYNDSPSFGPEDGELTGQALLHGTYTLGLGFGWEFSVDGVTGFLDVGEATFDILVGGSASLAPREVTQAENCARCHVELRAHGGERRQLLQCLMCHTSGAEDANDPLVGGGTPGVSIESRVMFHKLHNARHLPSVLGIGVLPSGDLDYTVTPRPLTYATSAGELVDYSWIGFPAFPNRAIPREKNLGYSALSADAQAREDGWRTGIVECRICHGDPDGQGPIEPPEQGDLVYAQPTRRACGACHDDIDWALPYITNNQEMPADTGDSDCIQCHESDLTPLGVRGGHAHPLDDPFLDPGRNLALLGLADLGGDDDGSLDAGEQLQVTFTLTDDAGGDVAASAVDAIRTVLAGPTTSQQLLLDAQLPAAVLTGPQPFVALVQERATLEFLGDSTAAGGEVFSTTRAPHVAATGAETVLQLRLGAGAAASTAAAAAAPASFLDLVDATGFARDDVLVVDDGGAAEEYLVVQAVDGERVWFGAPGSPAAYAAGVRFDHPGGTSVQVVSLVALTEGVDYGLNPVTGRVTELIEFGAGRAVIASYTAPYELPARYPIAHHDSPDLGEVEGEWRGKALEPGTYALTLWAEDEFVTNFAGQTNVFPSGSLSARAELPVLDPGALEPYDRIELPAACNDCHQDLRYHAGRYRGFESCLACHGGSGAEDRPDWVSANAPATDGRRIDLRRMLHAVHRGRDLDDPAGYVVVGAGTDPYPDDFTVRTWEDTRFPVDPGASANCAKCHGGATSWEAPPERGHPVDQALPALVWRDTCTSCHDSAAAGAHVDSHTAGGVESCTICHGVGETWSVSRTHRGY